MISRRPPDQGYGICTRCVMDTTDLYIEFDDDGVCNHCRYFDKVVRPALLPEDQKQTRLSQLIKDIKQVNLNLWNIEDKLRICEKNQDFGENFIKLARGVYINNDKRSKIKFEINKISGSNIKEIKQYVDY